MVISLLFLGLLFFFCLLKWNKIKYSKKGLPPGTMGWPFFGETSEFLKQGPEFMKNQRARLVSFICKLFLILAYIKILH